MSPWFIHLISQPFAPPTMPVEEFDDGAEHVVRVELPDLDPARQLRVAVLDRDLCVRADRGRGCGSAACRVHLPPRADRDTLVAEYHRGVLEIRMAVAPDAARLIPIAT